MTPPYMLQDDVSDADFSMLSEETPPSDAWASAGFSGDAAAAASSNNFQFHDQDFPDPG